MLTHVAHHERVAFCVCTLHKEPKSETQKFFWKLRPIFLALYIEGRAVTGSWREAKRGAGGAGGPIRGRPWPVALL